MGVDIVQNLPKSIVNILLQGSDKWSVIIHSSHCRRPVLHHIFVTRHWATSQNVSSLIFSNKQYFKIMTNHLSPPITVTTELRMCSPFSRKQKNKYWLSDCYVERQCSANMADPKLPFACQFNSPAHSKPSVTACIVDMRYIRKHKLREQHVWAHCTQYWIWKLQVTCSLFKSELPCSAVGYPTIIMAVIHSVSTTWSASHSVHLHIPLCSPIALISSLSNFLSSFYIDLLSLTHQLNYFKSLSTWQSWTRPFRNTSFDPSSLPHPLPLKANLFSFPILAKYLETEMFTYSFHRCYLTCCSLPECVFISDLRHLQLLLEKLSAILNSNAGSKSHD